MAGRNPNHRRVKRHYTYTIDELARLFGVHDHTVRNWQKAGLPPVDNGRPALFKGEAVASFLKMRRQSRKRPCGPGEMFCLPCREPKRPDGNLADYQPKTPTSGRLVGFCPTCGRMMFRQVARNRLDVVASGLDLQFPMAEPRLGDCSNPPVNCDFNKGLATL